MSTNGTVKVVKGKFIVTNPQEQGSFATIYPLSLGKIYINGVEITKSASVCESDKITYELEKKPSTRNIIVKVVEENLKALITLKYESGQTFCLKDSDALEMLIPEVVCKTTEIPEKFTFKEILSKLQDSNVVYGIMEDKIRKMDTWGVITDEVVAEGTPAIDAEDDKIIFEERKVSRFSFNNNSKNNIDYKDINNINSIENGQVIGTLVPGKDAKEGITVYGRPIKNKVKKRNIITCDEGCLIIGNKIVAKISGELSFNNFVVSVKNHYIRSSDVDIKTGNINFPGNVTVNGNVMEGMYVRAFNELIITGGVFKSNVQAGENITINGNIMNSSIIAGGDNFNKNIRANNLSNLEYIFDQLIKSINFLTHKGVDVNDKNIGILVKTLLESKYKESFAFFNETVNISKNSLELDDPIVETLKNKFIGSATSNINSIHDIRDILKLVRNEKQELDKQKDTVAKINLKNCQESDIQASDKITVSGGGVFASNIESLDSIIFEKSSSVCRGGHLKARKYIKAGVVGSESGSNTVLEVTDGSGRIEISVVHENTLLVISNKKYLTNSSYRNVTCFIDGTGELVVEKLLY